MIFQVIDNTSWASLLVKESKNWKRETRDVENENNSNRYPLNSKNINKTIQVIVNVHGENHV